MKRILPLSEDFLYCDPQQIKPEFYRISTDQQASAAVKHRTTRQVNRQMSRTMDYRSENND